MMRSHVKSGWSAATQVKAVSPEIWDIDNQFDLATPDGNHLEGPRLVSESNDSPRPADPTLQAVGMNIPIEDSLVQKTAFLYCTPGTPNV
jgi:hypothetical protein